MVVESHSWEEGSVVVAGDNPGVPNMGDNRTFPGPIWESMDRRSRKGNERRRESRVSRIVRNKPVGVETC